MSDIRVFLEKSKVTNGENGAGDAGVDPKPPPPKLQKKQTIEQIYQKKTQLEHILLRPDTYIGSVEKTKDTVWVYDDNLERMVQKELEYSPGLYKIFDEILVNAADNKQRDKKMDCIKIDINQEDNIISVWNNGQGIPVTMHNEENMYVPTMIFGHLLTSSNYNDDEQKVTGGRNGFGAKLTNIFSTKFTVETATKQYKRQFKQTWGSNMTKASEPKIKDFFGDDFTKITFSPDLEKFKMDKLDDNIVDLMSRRAYDIAASTRGVRVFLNGKRLPVKNFKDYVDLYVKKREDHVGNPIKVVYEQPDERWEVAVTISSDDEFQQVSFVNSIATMKGGRHVDYIADMISKQLIDVLKKKNKGGIQIKPAQVKKHMFLFINCLIVNPAFNSQTKELLTSQQKNFGSKCTLSEKFITQVTKSGIIEAVLSWAKQKAQTELEKTSGKKKTKLKGIAKLEDANEAGGKHSIKCTLILTEGDSAKSLVVSGLGVVGRDYYGVFPLKGKLLNVREATHKQILENAEINNIINIIGLKYKKKYLTINDMKELRYGKVMIMTDQDQDGSHIKGLLINFIHHNWPELLRMDFLEEFITPIVKARKKNEELSFYSLPEFEEWKNNTANHHTYTIKYYKGLGTSSSKEAKEYFTNMDRHRIRFRYDGTKDDDHIVLAFSKKHIEHRKEWLTNFMVESRRRKEMGFPEKYLYAKDTKFVSYTDFVNLELVLFSNADNVRSIPSLVDGLKPGQRKVLFTCFKRNDKKEVKVAQLAGSVAEMSAYHHGEQSLCSTIVNLAQNYVGSNNINLLEPHGQFGTRLTGGKDSASARYIFTKLSPLARRIFHQNDDSLLKHEYDDNQKIEPVWYIPIIPMILVNGADGIGTGWMTKIPNYNPRDIAACLRRMLDGEEPKELVPWYKNFIGTVEYYGEGRYVISGEISITGRDEVEITELPIGTWTQNYKENVLESLMHGAEKEKDKKDKDKKDNSAEKVKKSEKLFISDYKEYTTDTTVKFIVTIKDGHLDKLENEGLHKVFKLQTMMSTTSMCAFDELGCLRKFDSVMDILREFYQLRIKMYQKRKDYLEGVLEAEANKLSNQARFIMEKCSGELTVENKKRKTIVEELIKRGYQPDPVKLWKERAKQEEEDEVQDQEEDSDKKEGSEVKNFDYLLGMSMWMLTEERKNELLKQRDTKKNELESLRKKTPSDLWRDDLDAFLETLEEVERKEKEDEMVVKKDKDKKGAKKKQQVLLKQEALPSPGGRRVVPTVTDDMKKKIQNAIKSKENKTKRIVKMESQEDEMDEFDEMVKSKKTLKDKLGTPEEAEKKVRKKKETGKDGFKQTKLNFGKANDSPKKRGKKKFNSDSEASFDGSGSDNEFSPKKDSSSPLVKERTNARRAATKVIKYNLSDDDEDEKMSDNDVLFDNDAVKETSKVVEKIVDSSDSESEKTPPARINETSDDLFDSLLKETNGDVEKDSPEKSSEIEVNKRKLYSDSDSDDDMFKEKEPKKKEKEKEATKPKKPRAKKKKLSSDDEDTPPKKSKKKKKKGSDSDDFEMDDDDFVPSEPKAGRPGRGAATKKYTFSDSDSD